MRRVCLGLFVGLALLPAASRAEDTPARACDLAAASPYDATRPSDIPGVILEKVDGKIAVPACETALAADPENVRLLYQMGRALYASRDYDRARTFYEKAVAQGHPGAQHNLAIFHMNGLGGLEKSGTEAARLFKLAADQGLSVAQYVLADAYVLGILGLPQDDREAARLYKLAADQGLAQAQYKLSTFYSAGRGGLEKDDNEAARLLKLATDQRYTPVQLSAASFNGGLSKRDEDTLRLYKLAADQGSAAAQDNLAEFYLGHAGWPEHEEEAMHLYKLAADQGLATAQFVLGYFYAFGRHGLQQDDREAARLYKLAADQNHAQAQFELASFYKTGRGGLEKNNQEAARLLKLAADQGYSPAQDDLLLRAFAGVANTPRPHDRKTAGHRNFPDEGKIEQWLMQRAEEGNAEAQYRLGSLYETGLGIVPRNRNEAARLYSLAAKHGRTDAKAALRRVVGARSALYQ